MGATNIRRNRETKSGRTTGVDKDSSKPPSSDLIKRSEKIDESKEEEEGKKKAGGQIGHKGKTRKGFNRVDRFDWSLD